MDKFLDKFIKIKLRRNKVVTLYQITLNNNFQKVEEKKITICFMRPILRFLNQTKILQENMTIGS